MVAHEADYEHVIHKFETEHYNIVFKLCICEQYFIFNQFVTGDHVRTSELVLSKAAANPTCSLRSGHVRLGGGHGSPSQLAWGCCSFSSRPSGGCRWDREVWQSLYRPDSVPETWASMSQMDQRFVLNIENSGKCFI